MEYEDKQIEDLLKKEGQGVQPSHAVAWRILHALPAKKSKYWILGILAPALAIFIFVFVQHKEPSEMPQEQEIAQEQAAFDQELADEDNQLFDDLDFFEDESIIDTL